MVLYNSLRSYGQSASLPWDYQQELPEDFDQMCTYALLYTFYDQMCSYALNYTFCTALNFSELHCDALIYSALY